MKDQVRVTGIVLSVFPVGENDRRLTILTKERGKIQVFARGCRKPNSPLFGVSQPLIYCEFMITEGRNASYLNSAEARDYFPWLKSSLEQICYSTYFAELAEYFTVEGMDERNILNLLFVTIKAMEKEQVSFALIRRIYEYRILHYYGIGLMVSSCLSCGRDEGLRVLSIEDGGVFCDACRDRLHEGGIHSVNLTPAVLYALQYAAQAPLSRLYTFNLADDVMAEFSWIVKHFMRIHVDHRFRSAEMLKMF